MITFDEAMGLFLFPGMALAGSIFGVLGGIDAFIWTIPVGPTMAGISVLVILKRRGKRRPMEDVLRYWNEVKEGGGQ